MKEKELKHKTVLLRELALSRGETVMIMNDAIQGFAKELRSAQSLSRRNNNGSRLIKIGFALVAFPDPTITEVLGWTLVAAGVIQSKIKRSTLQLEDVYKTFPQVVKELHLIRQGLAE